MFTYLLLGAECMMRSMGMKIKMGPGSRRHEKAWELFVVAKEARACKGAEKEASEELMDIGATEIHY